MFTLKTDGLGSKEPAKPCKYSLKEVPEIPSIKEGYGEAGALTVGTPPHEFIANFRL